EWACFPRLKSKQPRAGGEFGKDGFRILHRPAFEQRQQDRIYEACAVLGADRGQIAPDFSPTDRSRPSGCRDEYGGPVVHRAEGGAARRGRRCAQPARLSIRDGEGAAACRLAGGGNGGIHRGSNPFGRGTFNSCENMKQKSPTLITVARAKESQRRTDQSSYFATIPTA